MKIWIIMLEGCRYEVGFCAAAGVTHVAFEFGFYEVDQFLEDLRIVDNEVIRHVS